MLHIFFTDYQLNHILQKIPLQTGFLAGMEEILGVTQDRQVRRGSLTRGVEELGEDASEADLQNEAEGNDAARHRYQRMFWEPVLEGKVGTLDNSIRPPSDTLWY